MSIKDFKLKKALKWFNFFPEKPYWIFGLHVKRQATSRHFFYDSFKAANNFQVKYDF